MRTYVKWLICGAFLTALLISFGVVRSAQACAFAKRIRRFPLGTADGKIAIAEFEEYRTHVRSWLPGPVLAKPKLYWRGQFWLRWANAKGKLLGKRGKALGRYWASLSYHYRDLRHPLRQVLKHALKNQGFRTFKSPKLYRCAGKQQCGPIRLMAQQDKALYVATGSGKMRVDARDVHWLKMNAGENQKAPVKNSRLAYVLQYTWGARVVFALYVSPALSGPRMSPVGWKDRYCRSLTTCAAPAGVTAHESGIDVLAVMPQTWFKAQSRRNP